MPAQYELDVKQGENILPVRAGDPFNHILFGIRFVRIGVKRRLGNDLQPNARVYRPFEGLKAALAFQQRPSRDPNSQESLARGVRSDAHPSELQSQMRNSITVLCLKNKNCM